VKTFFHVTATDHHIGTELQPGRFGAVVPFVVGETNCGGRAHVEHLGLGERVGSRATMRRAERAKQIELRIRYANP
jgi:hypothetical protein